MYCSKCGHEISENSKFCGNCGNQINKGAKTIKDFRLPKSFEAVPKFDTKKVLSKIKGYFSHFYVDYNSKSFKFAMIIFLAIGIGEPLYSLISYFLPFDIYSLFSGAATVFKFLVCAVLFDLLAFLLLKLKGKETIKKSNFVRIFWIVSLALNALVFLVGIDISQYILYSNIAVPIVELMAVVSTALLFYINKPKYPIALFISLLSFALSKSSLWLIESDFALYNIRKTTDYYFDIFTTNSLGYILLVLVIFALAYIFPKKISKWLLSVPSLFIITVSVLNLIESFSLAQIIYVILDICIVTLAVLFALSCSREIEYKYSVINLDKTKKSVGTVGIISVAAIVVITLTYLLVSAIVCSVHINSGISKWKSQIISANLNSSAQWSSMNEDIFKYSSTKFVAQFIDEYNLYNTLVEKRYTMKRISICYSAYKNGTVNEDIIEEYSYITVNDSWANNSILSPYYKKYLEMQPKIENVSVSASVDVNKGQIEVTVSNDNQMPISKCTVDCKFTIIFVESGYYSNNTEYGRGTKTITVEDIAGNSEKTETVSFNPDDYYDSYGSYITSFLMDKSVSIVSIE